MVDNRCMSQPVPPGRGFEAVLSHLSDAIIEGTYRAGQQIPPERVLAERLGVSRGAVREAIKVLQAQGIVTSESGPGRGTRISTAPGPAFGRMLRLHLALHATNVDEVTATRVVLEREAARGAARMASPRGLAGLEGLLATMEAVEESEEFNRLDTDFHVAIAELADNRLVRDLTIAIREAVTTSIREAESRLADWPSLRAVLNRQHRGIHQAIVARDADGAAARIEEHIRQAHAALLGPR